MAAVELPHGVADSFAVGVALLMLGRQLLGIGALGRSAEGQASFDWVIRLTPVQLRVD